MNNVQQKQMFIVGAPRSGTTLLRELLCQHTQIAIPRDEFQLLPYFLRRFGNKGALTQSDLQSIKRVLRLSPFYYHLRTEKTLRDLALPEGEGIGAIVIEILKYFSPGSKGYSAPWIGEKTPGNLLHISTIATTYPQARFIHIVRDPRDVALSSRRAWGTSLTRTVISWERHIQHALDFSSKHPDRIHHLRYEDLITNPEEAMRQVSEFLGVSYETSISRLATSREQMGDATGRNYVMRSNSGKYLSQMKQEDIAKVDAHLRALLEKFGYQASNSNIHFNTSRTFLNLLAGIDFVRSFGRHISEKGLIDGIRYRLSQVLLR